MYLKSPAVSRLMNWGDGGVVETSRMFQFASAALNHPAFNARRGSVRGVAERICPAAAVARVRAATARNSLDFTESSV